MLSLAVIASKNRARKEHLSVTLAHSQEDPFRKEIVEMGMIGNARLPLPRHFTYLDISFMPVGQSGSDK